MIKKNFFIMAGSIVLSLMTLTSCENDMMVTAPASGVDASAAKMNALAATATTYSITPAVNSFTPSSLGSITENGGYVGGILKAQVIANPVGSPANSFTIKISKQDGSLFSSAGKLSLKLGTTTGIALKSFDYTVGGTASSFTLTFQVPTGYGYGIFHIYPVIESASGSKYFAEPAMVYSIPTYASGPYTAGMLLAHVNATKLYASGPTLMEGGAYQCVTFCKNYYSQVYGTTIGSWGNASKWKINYDKTKFTFYDNGSSTAPRIGDILCLDNVPSGAGHVGIITEVSSSQIKLANQNGGTASLKPIGWTVTRTGNTLKNPKDFIIQGWIRKKP